jgi:hypothetical protein
MPYVGVRTVLGAAHLLKHAEKFVQTLGVETLHDLQELNESDLAAIGLGSEFRRLRHELDRILHTHDPGVAARGGGRGGPRVENKFQQRRRAATEAILALGGGANATVGLFLEAGGATFYAKRLESLGVSSSMDLHLLTHRDLQELGMQVLHERRFLHAVRLAPRWDTDAIAKAAIARGGQAAAAATLCDALLIPMGLGGYCGVLAGRGKAAKLIDLCELTTLDIEAAALRLIERRRLFAAFSYLVPRVCPSSGGAAAAPARPASTSPSALVVDHGDGGGPPPRPASMRPSARAGAALLDGCRHVFLDVGANVGINHHHLFRWKAPHHEYRHGAMQPLFDRYFGHSKLSRRASVCSIGIEANPNHSPSLGQIARTHASHGIRTLFLTETAAASREGTVTFFTQNLTKTGRAVHEWGASVFQSAVIAGQGGRVTVRALDLARWVEEVVLSRRVPALPQHARWTFGEALARADNVDQAKAAALRQGIEGRATPSIVMKMDIEGSEFGVLSRLLSTGVLCRLDAAAIEWHDERKKGTRPIHAATGAPTDFAALLSYVVASSRGESMSSWPKRSSSTELVPPSDPSTPPPQDLHEQRGGGRTHGGGAARAPQEATSTSSTPAIHPHAHHSHSAAGGCKVELADLAVDGT